MPSSPERRRERYATEPTYRARALVNANAYHATHKTERNTKAREWRLKNAAKAAANNKRWRAQHAEQAKANRARWLREHPDKAREIRRRKQTRMLAKDPDYYNRASREWRQRNPEKARKAVRDWQRRNPEKAAAATKDWQRRNLDKGRDHVHKRTALKKGSQVEPVDYVAVLKRDGRICYLCGQEIVGKVEFDHVVPLTRGGAHSMANLRPTHGTCNRWKNDRLIEELDFADLERLLAA